MSDLWRKTLVYLGLVEEPEEHDELPEEDVAPAARRTTRTREGARRAGEPPRSSAGGGEDVATIRPLPPRDTHVRALQGVVAPRVQLVRALSFDDAETVGERYRANQPVLLDLGQADKRTGRRLLDFVSGTIFALRGRILPVGERAFLLLPEGVEVPPEERQRLADLGYQLRPTGPTDRR